MTGRHWQKKHYDTIGEANEARASFRDLEAKLDVDSKAPIVLAEPDGNGGGDVLVGSTEIADDGQPAILPGYAACSPPLGY